MRQAISLSTCSETQCIHCQSGKRIQSFGGESLCIRSRFGAKSAQLKTTGYSRVERYVISDLDTANVAQS